MTKRIVLILTLGVLCLAAVVYVIFIHKPVTNVEKAARESVSQEVIDAFLAKDFTRLEDIATRYRESKSRTPSGLWTLGQFYSAFGQIYGHGESPEVWMRASEVAKEWINQFPDSPTPYIAYAQILSKLGWEFRGYHEASRVEEADWQPFHENQSSARAYLEAHKSIAGRDPHWYALMLLILKTEDVDDELVRQYYLEGVKLEPMYLPTHMEALYNFIPKWGGSVEAVDDFILLATQQVEESQRDMLYARLYWASMSNQFPEDRFFHETKVDWNRMKRGMTSVVTEYPDIWNIFFFTFFACYAGDKEVPTKYIPVLLEYEEGDSWFENYTAYKLCKEWIFNNGPNVDQALVESRQNMQEEELRHAMSHVYYEKNQQYKEQMQQDLLRRRRELSQNFEKIRQPSMEQMKAMEEEYRKLTDMESDLVSRDMATDWGLDYESDDSSPSNEEPVEQPSPMPQSEEVSIGINGVRLD